VSQVSSAVVTLALVTPPGQHWVDRTDCISPCLDGREVSITRPRGALRARLQRPHAVQRGDDRSTRRPLLWRNLRRRRRRRTAPDAIEICTWICRCRARARGRRRGRCAHVGGAHVDVRRVLSAAVLGMLYGGGFLPVVYQLAERAAPGRGAREVLFKAAAVTAVCSSLGNYVSMLWRRSFAPAEAPSECAAALLEPPRGADQVSSPFSSLHL